MFIKMLRRILLVNLLVSLSLTARAGDLSEIPAPSHEIELHLGSRAPFSGVLVDLDQYRYYKTIELSQDMIENRINSQGDYTFWKIFGGFALGFVAASLVHK